MNDVELRERYRCMRIQSSWGCSSEKAAQLVGRYRGLSDENFESLADVTGRALADARAKAGLQGTITPPPAQTEEEAEQTRAAVADYMDSVFDIND